MTYITGQPIVFVGTGQTYTDLRNLNAKAVVNALLKAQNCVYFIAILPSALFEFTSFNCHLYVYTHIPFFALMFGKEVSLNITRDLYCVFYNYVTFGDIQEYVYPTDQKINIHCNISIM